MPAPLKTSKPRILRFVFCVYCSFLIDFQRGGGRNTGADVAGGFPPEEKRRRENPFRKRAIERMNNALHFLHTLAEFREPYLLLKRYGIPLVPFSWFASFFYIIPEVSLHSQIIVSCRN